MLARSPSKFQRLFFVEMTLTGFALAFAIRYAGMPYGPLVVGAAVVATLVSIFVSPIQQTENRFIRHLAAVAPPYILAVPFIALADVIAAPEHRYLSVLVGYLLFGVVLIPGSALGRMILPSDRRDHSASSPQA
ncbi:MAG: hypothetical protein AB1942_03245 [Pseudomonadota bacterium]